MEQFLRSIYSYHVWATNKVFNSLDLLNEEEYRNGTAGGHGSVQETLAHLLSVERGWFSWFDGTLPPEQAYMLKIKPEEIPTVTSAKSVWETLRTQIESTIEKVDGEKIFQECSWTIAHSSSSFPYWQLLFHVANHGTHMRAQLNAAVRRAGHAPQGIDYIHYLMERTPPKNQSNAGTKEQADI